MPDQLKNWRAFFFQTKRRSNETTLFALRALDDLVVDDDRLPDDGFGLSLRHPPDFHPLYHRITRGMDRSFDPLLFDLDGFFRHPHGF